MRPIPILTALSLACAAPAFAQVPPPYVPPYTPYTPYPGGAPAAIADQHRYENDRLRLQAQANADLARQQQVETQLRLRAIEAARAPIPNPAVPARPLYSPEQERALREGAAARRDQTAQGVGQIDDWLDRPR